MMYKARNVDTDKALEYIDSMREYYESERRCQEREIKKYYEGFNRALDIVKEIFECSNFEKDVEGCQK